MSIESVYKKCILLKSDEQIEQIKQGLLENIEQHKDRFERAVYTFWNESQSMATFNMLAGHEKYKDMTDTQVKRAFFEAEKERHIKRYLEFLCDLFDYENNNN